MRNQLSNISIFLTFFSFAVVTMLLSGCHKTNSAYTKNYCDDTGCFYCDAYENCQKIPNTPCTSDKQCNTGEKCTNIGCAPTCSGNISCPSDTICTNGFCVPEGFSPVPYKPSTPCKKNTECEADEFCDEGKCKVRCKSDDDCAPGNVCSECGKCQPKGVPVTCGSTIEYCSATGSCNTGKTCIKTRCHFDCKTFDSCPTGQICSNNVCIDDPDPSEPECALDLECGDGSCINGYCHPSCKNSQDCNTTELCIMSICQPNYNPSK